MQLYKSIGDAFSHSFLDSNRSQILRVINTQVPSLELYLAPRSHFLFPLTHIFSEGYSDKDIHHFFNARFNDSSLKHIFLGMNYYKIPQQILENMPMLMSLQLFAGLHNALENIKGRTLRYQLASSQTSLSTIELLDRFLFQFPHFETCGQDPNNIFSSNPEDGSVDYRIYLEDRNIESYLCQYHGPLPSGSVSRVRHADKQRELSDKLREEGFSVFCEVDINCRAVDTRVDVVAIKYGDFRVYELKNGSQLGRSYLEPQLKLKQVAKFFYYNFGLMPEIILKSGLGSELTIGTPKVKIIHSVNDEVYLSSKWSNRPIASYVLSL
ncbi:MAG: hypothetical protein ABIJ34_06060 [archaeon]